MSQARILGFAPIATVHLPLPTDKTRYVGEPVAIIVARKHRRRQRRCGIARHRLRAATRRGSATDALKPGPPLLWEIAPGNLCIDIELGDEAATDAAFAAAAHVVRLETWAQRVTGVPMEPRTNVADYDAATGRYTLYTGSGRGVAKVRLDLAEVLGVSPEQVRVHVP